MKKNRLFSRVIPRVPVQRSFMNSAREQYRQNLILTTASLFSQLPWTEALLDRIPPDVHPMIGAYFQAWLARGKRNIFFYENLNSFSLSRSTWSQRFFKLFFQK